MPLKFKHTGYVSGHEILIFGKSRFYLECLKCKERRSVVEDCQNCNSKTFEPSYFGLHCWHCQLSHPQNRWICDKCTCNNPINPTIFEEQES